ncbi:MAG: pyridoxamine 5'-phosphate oxidase [Prolixibacteraceae bacterium]|jgi:pyridoxamine 5'-phosphate oxidase|nr:pyridoxamine 5'-phosphate oxidase [Prolixibacteraceae bacterium]MDD4757006.1 pyridoxamine 5'-phosphate oxidase [Prolixibacteraceae bacterium]NLO01325.1 pyridoxamine 5'-phosphate oxidase [Bacteroidales bacterium]
MNINSVRNEYDFPGISLRTTDKDPFKQFKKWLEDALDSKEKEPTAMSLSTYGYDGFPDSRIVLLKYFDEHGFIFFTNYHSDKGRSIEKIPAVGLHFFWPILERQIRITGYAAKTSREVSKHYFHTRPLKSQIAAIVSDQSRVIPSRKYLETKFREWDLKYKLKEPPAPSDWGGYIVSPVRMEFWQGRLNRLHDRIVYKKNGNIWKRERLAP